MIVATTASHLGRRSPKVSPQTHSMLALEFVRPDAGADVPRPSAVAIVEEWQGDDGVVVARAYAEAATRWVEWPGVATYWFHVASETVRARPREGATRHSVVDVYQRHVAPLALQARGFEAIHASAVSTGTGVVALAGKSGAGKSTLAYRLSIEGLAQVADDAVVLSITGDGHARLQPLPFRPRLRQDAAVRLDARQPSEVPGSDHQNDGRVTDDRLLQAIYILKVCGHDRGSLQTEPAVLRLEPANAFRALLTHACCFELQGIARRRRTVEHYLDLAEATPVFEFRFSHGLERLDDVANALRTEIMGPSRADVPAEAPVASSG